MISETLFPMLILIIALLTLSLIIFFINKTLANRAKVKTLSAAKNKAEEYIEKNALELTPILTNFYGEKSEHYLKNIKKQNQLFCNQLILLMMEYKPNIVNTLTGTLEIVHDAYINVFYEASQNHIPLAQEPQADLTPIDQDIKETILIMAQLCHQEIDENTLNNVESTKKIIRDCKEKIEAMSLENKTGAEESTQYLDLIEQLRLEKKNMRQTISQALEILEQIYQKYQTELALPENATFKQFDYDALISVFKLSK
jgi:hypothetical protein